MVQLTPYNDHVNDCMNVTSTSRASVLIVKHHAWMRVKCNRRRECWIKYQGVTTKFDAHKSNHNARVA